MTDRYAVIGNPIAHSKSPLIHHAFAGQTAQDLQYTRLLGDPAGFEEEVRRFFREGGKGLNVTVPFKERACVLADHCTARALGAGAVNTLLPDGDGRLQGDNTDGVGLVRDLTVNQGYLLSGSRVLLLGAGGAARGVVHPLLDTGVESLVIANRTASRAVELAGAFPDGAPLRGCGLDELDREGFDLIINATSAGLDGRLPRIPDNILAPGGWVYDMMYASEPTAMVRWGQRHRASRAVDGLGMLVEQAAESFYLWRGVRPDTAPVIRSLREAAG